MLCGRSLSSTEEETEGQHESKQVTKEANTKGEAIRILFCSWRIVSFRCVGGENHNDPVIFFTNTHPCKLGIVQTHGVLRLGEVCEDEA